VATVSTIEVSITHVVSPQDSTQWTCVSCPKLCEIFTDDKRPVSVNLSDIFFSFCKVTRQSSTVLSSPFFYRATKNCRRRKYLKLSVWPPGWGNWQWNNHIITLWYMVINCDVPVLLLFTHS
jgi:hypothetical protein